MLFRKKIHVHRTSARCRLTGNVELDESYIGPRRVRGRATKRGRVTHKQPVLGIFEINGTVYTKVVPNCRKCTLQSLILGKVSKESVVHSDGWRGFGT